ncbi:hypothetical protein KEM52_002305 [Ascosphaera acerosa]|nr:hypothetical protein KEM52_002305 [Ascosphaera acerosa]
MPHYIRFLKPPQAEASGRGGLVKISCLVTITNDLGDELLWEAVPLTAQLLARRDDDDDDGDGDGGSLSICASRAVVWAAGARSVQVVFGPLQLRPAAYRVYVAHESGPEVGVGGARWAKAERLVERRLQPDGAPLLSVWEETGESIARHLWDAALATVVAIQPASTGAAGHSSTLRCLQRLLHRRDHAEQPDTRPAGQHRRTLQVLELGAGCGMVGIHIAQSIPHARVLLTDLDEARAIASRNLQSCRAALARGSSVAFAVLDWAAPELPPEVRGMAPDLVLVSDCTYNEDSFAALTATLARLAAAAPGVLVVVAYKKRHRSEAAFFEHMAAAGFVVREQTSLPLPDLTASGSERRVELFAFAARDVHGPSASAGSE